MVRCLTEKRYQNDLFLQFKLAFKIKLKRQSRNTQKNITRVSASPPPCKQVLPPVTDIRCWFVHPAWVDESGNKSKINININKSNQYMYIYIYINVPVEIEMIIVIGWLSTDVAWCRTARTFHEDVPVRRRNLCSRQTLKLASCIWSTCESLLP